MPSRVLGIRSFALMMGVVACLALPTIADAGDITLAWNPNSPSENVQGYRVYVGTAAGTYTVPGSPFNVVGGNVGQFVFTQAAPGVMYFFAVSAYNAGGESPRSPEISGFTSGPGVTITIPTSANTFNAATEAFTLGGTATDDVMVTNVTWSNDRGGSGTASLGGTPTSATWTANLTLAQGVNVLTVTARDASAGTATDTLTVTLDTVAPVVTITAPTAAATLGTNTAAITLGGSASDAVGVTQVTWSNDRGGSGTATGTTSWSANLVLQTGVNVLTVTARDAANNTATDTLTVTLDLTAPVVTITTPTAADTFVTTSPAFTFGGTATDAQGVTQVTWINSNGGATGTATLGGTPTAATWSASLTLPPGNNVLTVTARDAANNTATDTLTVSDGSLPLSGVLDTFSGSNGTPLSSHTPVVAPSGAAWTVSSGSPSPVLQNGTVVAAGGTGFVVATINSGLSDGVVAADFRSQGTAGMQYAGVVFRAVDSNNLMLLRYASTSAAGILQLFVRVGGNFTLLAGTMTLPPGAAGALHRLEARFVGSTITAVLDNAVIFTAPVSQYQTATRHGLLWHIPSDANPAFDNFAVTASGASPPADTTAPAVTITTPTASPTFTTGTAAFTVGGTASDAVGVTQVTWSNDRGGSGVATLGGAATAATWTANLTLVSGANVLTVTARDAANNSATDTLTVTYSPAAPSSGVLDTFTGSNGTLLAAHAADTAPVGAVWTVSGGTPSPVLQNGTVVAAGGTGFVVATINSGLSDGVVAADFRSQGTAGMQYAGVVFRAVDSNNLMLLRYASTSAAGILQLFVRVGGNFTLLAGTMTLPPGAAGALHRLEARFVGSTITAVLDNAVIFTAPVSQYQTATRHGLLWHIPSDANPAFDNFAVTASGASPPADTTAPAVTITTPTASPTFTTGTAAFTVGGTASDAVGVTQVTWSNDRGGSGVATLGGAATAATWTANLTLVSGANVLTVTARDAANNSATDTLTVTYSPAAPSSGVLDTFTGSNGTLLAAHAADTAPVGAVWTVSGGTPSPVLQNGTVVAAGGTGFVVATINSGLSDGVVAADFRSQGTAGMQYAGVVFRAVDSNNLVLLRYASTSAAGILQLFACVGGNFTLLAGTMTLPPGAAGALHRLEARFVGSTITAVLDNAVIFTAPVNLYQTATRHGLLWHIPSDANPAFDNFAVTASGASPPADTTAPAVTITTPTASPTFTTGTAAFTVGGTASDAVGVTQVTWSNDRGGSGVATLGGAATAATWTANLTLVSGANVLTVTARDAANNSATDTLTVTYSPAAPSSGVLDTFTGSNGTLLAAHAADTAPVGAVWTVSGGTPSPVLQNGTVVAAGGTGFVVATINSGLSDGVVAADFRSQGTAGMQYAGVVFRAVDSNNLMLLRYASTPAAGILQLFACVGGNFTLLAGTMTLPPGAAGALHRLEARFVGSTITAVLDNAVIFTAPVNLYQTATRHGLLWHIPSDANPAFDNFAVTASGASPPADTTAPAVTITTPTASPTFTTGTAAFTVGGTASDAVGVTQVTWSNDRGGSGVATLGGAATAATWTANLTLVSGANVLTVTARDAANNSATDTLTVTYSPAATSSIRLDVGSTAVFADSAGNAWLPDQFSSGGTVAYRSNAIDNTVDDDLYRTYRFGNFNYAVPVANGTYVVYLEFIEPWWSAPGQRVFSVSAEGATALANIDLYAIAGRSFTAVERTFNVTVSDGVLNLSFTSSVDNAIVSAIAIVPRP